MDVKTINDVFSVGKYLILTPSSLANRKPTSPQKLQILLGISFATFGLLQSQYGQRKNVNRVSFVLLILRALMDVSIFCNLFYILIRLMLFGRERWFVLVQSLMKVRSPDKPIGKVWMVLPNCLFLFMFFVISLFYVKKYGIARYLRVIFVEHCQMYCVFFYHVFAYVILVWLLRKYRHQKRVLLERSRSPRSRFESLRRNLLLLRVAAEDFDALFGCVIFFNVIYCVTRGIFFVNIFMKELVKPTREVADAFHVVFSMVFTLFLWGAFSAVVLACDAILREFDEIVDVSCKVEMLDPDAGNRPYPDVILRLRPDFTAAGFCSLRKSTIFRVLESFTTFLFVVIQFKENV